MIWSLKFEKVLYWPLIFWCNQESVSDEFIQFFDKQNQSGSVLVSSLSFWEAALLVRKGKLDIKNIEEWSKELLANTNLKLINPSISAILTFRIDVPSPLDR